MESTRGCERPVLVRRLWNKYRLRPRLRDAADISVGSLPALVPALRCQYWRTLSRRAACDGIDACGWSVLIRRF